MGEMGELAELFQFKGDAGSYNGGENQKKTNDDNGKNDSNKDRQQQPYLSATELDKVGQEIADVSIYLLRLADVCGVKLQDALELYYLQQSEKE